MKFRLIDSGYSSPSMNMAIDEALLTSTSPVLRLYQWTPSSLSLGYFQSISQINQDFCKDNDIEIVRRLTGGNAVLHDKELTYSFIIDEKLMPESVIDSYKEISKGLLKALNILNLNPKMNQDVNSSEKSAVCFNDPSWYEILVNNKKIIGSAQKRINNKLLQHGSILLNINLEKYSNCFNSQPKNLASRVTSINDELNSPISETTLKQVIIQGFKEELDIDFENSSLTKEELILAQKLSKEKYSIDSWNLKR